MNAIGIIAEYNPFHNGHRYQIEKAKKLTGAEHVVIVMSGDFVQRGAPAFTDKYLRTEMALSCGADFVFELPATFSCASAEYFASAGISLLSSLGFVDGLCFGAECGELSLLKKIADVLADSPAELEQKIHAFVSEGMSYPKAREQALKLACPDLYGTSCQTTHTFSEIFSSPNNILAIEYLKALAKEHSTLEPLCIRRTDAGYHETGFPKDSSFASASALRALFPDRQESSLPASAADYLPEPVWKLLEKKPARYPVLEDDFSTLLYYRLLHLSEDDFSILDMNRALYHRIQTLLNQYESVSAFTELLKTKQFTYSRISRLLFHLLLDIRTPASSCVPYARLLGFRKEKSHLLRQVKKIPVITKPADGLKMLSADCDAEKLYERDLFAASLYRQVQMQKKKQVLPTEYQAGPVIL